MPPLEISQHAQHMLTKRGIPETWLWRVLSEPDMHWLGPDNNQHYAKAIEENQHRMLHVVINHHVEPNRVVTLFFDRRLG